MWIHSPRDSKHVDDAPGLEIHAFTHAYYARVFMKMQAFGKRLTVPWPTFRRQPKDSVEQFQGMLQEIDDEAVRKLARQIGTNPEEEPYEGESLGRESLTRVLQIMQGNKHGFLPTFAMCKRSPVLVALALPRHSVDVEVSRRLFR
jgi:hypothetical protein